LDNGATWAKDSGVWPDWLFSVAATTDHSIPIAVKDLAMDLVINTEISPTNRLTLNNEVPLDGSATLEMKYL
jgi:hypothetical protein